MASIAEFTIPAEEFALRETLERRPELVCEVERVVAHDTTHIIPFISEVKQVAFSCMMGIGNNRRFNFI